MEDNEIIEFVPKGENENLKKENGYLKKELIRLSQVVITLMQQYDIQELDVSDVWIRKPEYVLKRFSDYTKSPNNITLTMEKFKDIKKF